jgi:hypothetical protein
MLLLLTLACGRFTEPAPEAQVAAPVEVQPPALDEPPEVQLRDEDAPPAMPHEVAVPVPVEDKESAVKHACARLVDCGCSDGQVYEDCVQSAMQTHLPDRVYRCIASRPCEALCEEKPGGTHDKGMKDCVDPWLEETIGRGQGLKKRK